MRKIVFTLLFAFAGTLLHADWETSAWTHLAEVAFGGYADGERLNATNGVYHGYWVTNEVGLADLGSAMKRSDDVMYMRLELTDYLAFVSERPGRTGGGNVLLFSVQTMARTNLEALSDCKGGFVVALDTPGPKAVFCGWTAGGWRKLTAPTVVPTIDESWYEGAMRFRVDDESGRVQVQYLLKGAAGYEVLSDDTGDIWHNTGITDGNASVRAVDFYGVGGLERLSSREKNGFSVRLR